MKRYLFGLVALLLAVGFSAFTIPAKKESAKRANAFFMFDYATYPSPTLANVTDESKWIKVTDISPCSDVLIKACGIEVSDTYYSGSTLLSTAALTAVESSTNVAYITGGNTVDIVNRN